MITPILVSVFLALAFAADLYTTKRAVIDNPTRFHEGNPIMGAVLKPFGIVGLAVVKSAVLGVALWGVWSWREWSVYGPVLAAGAGTAYIAWRNKRLIAAAKS